MKKFNVGCWMLGVGCCALLSGCAILAPSPELIHALAADTNSVEITITTLQGSINIKRNMDRRAAPPAGDAGSAVTITPATTLNVTPQK